MNKIIWIFMAFLAGAFLPIQAGLNARISKATGSPVMASAISFVIGSAVLIAYLLITQQQISWSGLKNTPSYVWLGGLLGAFYVTAIILAFPKLGPGLTFGLVVSGQMILSVFLEHNNILVAQQSSISINKIIGIGLIIVGVILIRR